MLGRFWRGLRRSFGRALLLGLLDLLLALVIASDIWFFRLYVGGVAGALLAFLFGSMGVLVLLVNLFLWPLLAWYPQPLGKLVRRAFLLTAAHPFHALGGVAGASITMLLLAMLPKPFNALSVAMGPGAAAAVAAVAAWQAMKRYAGEDDEFAE